MTHFTKKIVLNAAWLIIALLLIIGASAPMFTFTQFYFFDDTFSLVGGIFHLLSRGELVLFTILFCFSLLMPLLKMLMLLYTINVSTLQSNQHLRRLSTIALIGKWSMLDVFVVAILAMTVKLSLVAEVKIHHGLLVFTIGVIASIALPMIVSFLLGPKSVQQINMPELTLDSAKLEQLFQQGKVSISRVDVDCDVLLDVFDPQKQWQAKVVVKQHSQEATMIALVATRITP